MMKLVAPLITAVYIVQYVASHPNGKEEPVPHLSKETLKALAPRPLLVHEKGIQSVATCYQGYILMSDGTCVKGMQAASIVSEYQYAVSHF